MSKRKCTRRKKGGSKVKPLGGAELTATPLVVFGPKYGNDVMSNAHGFLKHRAGKQQNMINALSGGKMTPLHPSTITVPQFHNINPSMPHGPNESSQVTNGNKVQNITNKKFDHYADVVGGSKRKSKKRKSKKRKSKKRKSRKRN